MKQIKKEFDAAKMMHSIRDKLNKKYILFRCYILYIDD
jgi:hypothetical protein